jgi:hypothetical protein
MAAEDYFALASKPLDSQLDDEVRSWGLAARLTTAAAVFLTASHGAATVSDSREPILLILPVVGAVKSRISYACIPSPKYFVGWAAAECQPAVLYSTIMYRFTI